MSIALEQNPCAIQTPSCAGNANGDNGRTGLNPTAPSNQAAATVELMGNMLNMLGQMLETLSNMLRGDQQGGSGGGLSTGFNFGSGGGLSTGLNFGSGTGANPGASSAQTFTNALNNMAAPTFIGDAIANGGGAAQFGSTNPLIQGIFEAFEAANAASANAFLSPADQKAADFVNENNNSGWIAEHGGYVRNDDGSFSITRGELDGYKAVPIPGTDGSYCIHNEAGQVIAQYDAPGGASDKVASPIVLDLDGSGSIETTGQTTAQDRAAGTQIGQTVSFDIDGDGTQDQIEWLAGSGDGLLVDTSKIGANGAIDGNALFGDQGGQFANGFEKLTGHDDNGDGQISGAELGDLAVWIDDGDAVLEAGELKSLSEVGITDISTGIVDVTNERGETLMRSTANGGSVVTEDVWFGQK